MILMTLLSLFILLLVMLSLFFLPLVFFFALFPWWVAVLAGVVLLILHSFWLTFTSHWILEAYHCQTILFKNRIQSFLQVERSNHRRQNVPAPFLYVQTYCVHTPLIVLFHKRRVTYIFSEPFYKCLDEKHVSQFLGSKPHFLIRLGAWCATKSLALKVLIIQFSGFMDHFTSELKSKILKAFLRIAGLIVNYLLSPLFLLLGWSYQKFWLMYFQQLNAQGVFSKELYQKLEAFLETDKEQRFIRYLFGMQEQELRTHPVIVENQLV